MLIFNNLQKHKFQAIFGAKKTENTENVKNTT